MQTKLGASSSQAEDDSKPSAQIPLGDTFAPSAANTIDNDKKSDSPDPLSNDLRNLTIADAPETFQRKETLNKEGSKENDEKTEHSSVGEYEEEKADRMGLELEDAPLTNSLRQEIGESPSRLEALHSLTFMGRNAPLNQDNQEATANFKTPTLTSLQNTRQKLIDSPQIATLKSSLQSSDNIKIDKIGAQFGEQIANEELTLQDKDIFVNSKADNNPIVQSPGEDRSEAQGSHLGPDSETGRETADLITKSQKMRKGNSNIKQGYSNDKLDLKKQQANMNLISYQTANFGASGDQAVKRGQGQGGNEEAGMVRNESKQSIGQNHMFSSMSDINFVAAAASDKKQNGGQNIITEAQRQKMLDTSNHWKVRTSMIDEIHITIQQAIDSNPNQILHESESLLEFFVQLLNDQNFKIVLMTLSIINLVIGMQQHLEVTESGTNKSTLTSQSLGKYIPRLVGKLADSKNIIRQQAIRALMGIYLIMRFHSTQGEQKVKTSPVGQKGQTKTQNNFVPLVLPYLCNSSSWHVREELLNVLIICFLKSKNIEAFGNSVYEFDQYKILEVLLQMLDDQKERIRFTALEAIVAFVSIGNKLSAQEIIYQLGDNSISELIKERLKAPAEMCPYLNDNGALELPYLEHVEIANQMQVDQVLQKREGLNSGPAGQIPRDMSVV